MVSLLIVGADIASHLTKNNNEFLSHKSMKTMNKIHTLSNELFLHPPYDSDQDFGDYLVCSDIIRMLTVKKFLSNE